MEGDVGNNSQPVSSDQQKNLPPSIRTRSRRKPTRMARLTLRCGSKVKVMFDARRLNAIGPRKKTKDNYISYLGFLGRKQPSILTKKWKDVSVHTKELIWQAILEKFDIFLFDGEKEVEFSLVDVKVQEKFRRKWVNAVGRRWSVFKTNLTTNYIYGKKKNEPPYLNDYEFLDKDTWDAFVAARLTKEEKEKRLKAQEIQSHNTCPQRCSRGGYELLTQKMMDEKLKLRQQEAADDPSAIICPPSPPSRHEKWKRARQNSSGEYISQEAKDIAEKINSLEQEQSSGSFVPNGRNDILVAATGKPDHPSRVRGVGEGHSVRTYFGKKDRAVEGMISRAEVAAIIAEMQANWREELKMLLSAHGKSAPETPTPVDMSAKGSCAPDSMANDIVDELNDEQGDYQLYVEDPHKRLVAYGRIHDLGSNLHHRTMKDDEVRVSVERVVVADALVPCPTDEVTKVGEATNQFIAWPKRLVVENGKQKEEYQRDLFPKSAGKANDEPQTSPTKKTDVVKKLWCAAADMREPRRLTIEAGIVSLMRTSVDIKQQDIAGLLITGSISVPVMKFYIKYLHSILGSSGRAERFGLMCPLTIQSHGSNEDMILIRNSIGEGNFDCFLLPVYENGWELMALCPKSSYIALFSCKGKVKKQKKRLHEGKKQKENIPEIMIETAFETYQRVQCSRANATSKPKWVYPKCCPQDAGDVDNGLFVMRHMLEIIKLDIVNSFEKVLNMEDPYSSNDIDDVRRRWAECFFEVINA